MPNLLWDNDIIFKSIDWGLQEFLLKTFSLQQGQNFHLAECKYVGRRKFAKDPKGSKKIISLESLLGELHYLPEQTDLQSGTIVKLLKTKSTKIDTGEALFVQYMQNKEGCLLTGDKRALNELQIISNSVDLSFLNGRVILWEDLLMHFLRKYPWKDIQNAVKKSNSKDPVFRTVFSKHNLGYKDNSKAIFALESYLRTNQTAYKQFLIPAESLQRIFP
ncbi:hypothetical protein EHQ92_16200 [Leptospira biflexa]|uniref:hypothetical protein n=1 Tax=Leptospira biflexa TaxID=172 RepID=UPI001091011C|nr:hypothetical protein [Leptospira biflexa]TGM42336.1 hypothetical protein EHQ92_16200 [Leptospira biflexa]TGM44222.1 hypothetical protein EHQ88_16535 [Leptospira biflexa]